MDTHDRDLLARFRRSLDEPDADEEEVMVLDYLESFGVAEAEAFRVALRFLLMTASAPPRVIRIAAHQEGVELPDVPFFES